VINWKCYPVNIKIPDFLLELVVIFEKHEAEISSDNHSLVSNTVLEKITDSLMDINYQVELSKKKEDKIKVPVTYKERGEIDLSFEADAYNYENRTVLEVEAGRAVSNYQFLKDLFQSCMMENVEYLCIAVRKTYRNNEDYKKVVSFFDALHTSNRIKLPLKGILIIGY